MGEHLVEISGVIEFQSDKYPECPRGFVPLKLTDKTAQPLIRIYAERHKPVDAEFSEDLIEALRLKGYTDEEWLVDLRQFMAETEEKAWNALRRYRFMEFAHQAELWASLHKLSGEKRRNPFGAVSRVGRNAGRK